MLQEHAAPAAPATTTERPLLEIRGLQKRYGKFTAVHHVELDVPPAQVFGILGPNGAGKTTTLRMITGLIQPTQGTISIDGHRIDTDPVAAKRITGFIPDRPYVYDKLTASEYMHFIAGLYSMKRSDAAARMKELLSLFELSEWGDSLIEGFSHGMKQRLVFAGALLPRPRLLVVDEPMVGLDTKGYRLVRGLFRKLSREEGLTILLSTHTMNVAEEVCDQIVIINHGKIVARGDMDQLRAGVGVSDTSTLEDVFLKLTLEEAEHRARNVAERFGASAGADGTQGGDQP
jgi:ABC-2 type transport system ATP-binding protein